MNLIISLTPAWVLTQIKCSDILLLRSFQDDSFLFVLVRYFCCLLWHLWNLSESFYQVCCAPKDPRTTKVGSTNTSHVLVQESWNHCRQHTLNTFFIKHEESISSKSPCSTLRVCSVTNKVFSSKTCLTHTVKQSQTNINKPVVWLYGRVCCYHRASTPEL